MLCAIDTMLSGSNLISFFPFPQKCGASIRTSVVWTSSWHYRRGDFSRLWCVISSEQGRMWCTCKKRHQLKTAPHSQGSHTIISLRPTQTLTKGMNQTKPWGEGRKVKVRVCVCVQCIWHSQTQRLGSNKQDETVSEGKEETFSGELQQEELWDRQGDTLSHKAQRYGLIKHFYRCLLEFWRFSLSSKCQQCHYLACTIRRNLAKQRAVPPISISL